ncbi:trypsin-like serine peptidase [Microbacterium sp. No. 7]|uniref:trypsin-like serine peptidase n=1 Tax=Microbacterium sp. No. 7 TaxID=1714373 RepID=UPI0006D03286|nr:trypsin-like peptidase domain-containing protein [Microbacterium sp. No. 7]ALJ21327.1 hypothetical protein AOA12_16035 [Microbacterium sp. No. 7]
MARTRNGAVSAAATIAAALLLAGCTATGTTDEALPWPEPTVPWTDEAKEPLASPLSLEALVAFSGVVALNAGSSCSGTLIDTGVPAGPGYVLTNGHCVGDVGRPPQQTTIDEDWFGTAEFLRAEGNLDGTFTAEVVELAYSTMRHTDTAIVRLDRTLGELQDLGLRAVPIAAAEPAKGSTAVNVGVPVQDIADPADIVLRRGECTLGAQHTLLESHWLWSGAWSNDCEGIQQGSSGSGVFAVDADGAPTEIVAMINTTSWGALAEEACELNGPCEVTADGVAMAPRTSYAQSVAGVGRCFDAVTGVFALGDACPLPVSDLTALAGGGAFRGGGLLDGFGRTPQAELVGARPGTVRTALVPLGDATACGDAATYAGADAQPLPGGEGVGWGEGLVVEPVLPETEGRYALCAVQGENYAGAATIVFTVDRTPPVWPAGATVERIDDVVVVQPFVRSPELANSRYTWGPLGEADCDDTASFEGFRIVPLMIEATDLPATYCLYQTDSAGNPTPVTRIDIPAL